MKKKLSIMLVMMLILISSITVYAESLETPHEKLVTNGYTTFIIESNGDVKGFGRNAKGEVGNGTTVDQLTPVPIEGLSVFGKIKLVQRVPKSLAPKIW